MILLFLLPVAGSARTRDTSIPSILHQQNARTANTLDQSIPTVGFCEIVKNAKLYFDKKVRVRAKYQMATEGRYLSDDHCQLSHDEQIGVGHAPPDQSHGEILNAEVRRIGSVEYGGRAMVTVVGVLRNSSLRAFAWYQYRFDIISVENISPVTVPYEGELAASVTYSATVRRDLTGGLSLIPNPRILEHHALRIEWTNLGAFPKLRNRPDEASEQQIVFTVLSDEIRQMTQLRWNRTLRCKIIRLD